MPYKDPEMARQKARQRSRDIFQLIKNDPIKLAEWRKKKREYQQQWRKDNLERSREICRESAKRNYDTEEHSAYIKDWRIKNPYNYEHYKQLERERDERMRLDAIVKLGGKCMYLKCKITDVRVLEGHHPNGRKNDIHAKHWWRHFDVTKKIIELYCSNHHIIKHCEGGSK